MEILAFSTPDCGLCRMASPDVARYAHENGITVTKVDASSDEVMRTRYDVMTVPTVVLTDEAGNALQKLVGVPEIKAFMNQ